MPRKEEWEDVLVGFDEITALRGIMPVARRRLRLQSGRYPLTDGRPDVSDLDLGLARRAGAPRLLSIPLGVGLFASQAVPHLCSKSLPVNRGGPYDQQNPRKQKHNEQWLRQPQESDERGSQDQNQDSRNERRTLRHAVRPRHAPFTFAHE